VAQGNLDEAISILQTNMEPVPASIDACALLSQLYWRKNDIPNYTSDRQALPNALENTKYRRRMGGLGEYRTPAESVSASLDMARTCRAAEGQQNFERAVRNTTSWRAPINGTAVLISTDGGRQVCL